MLAYLALLIAVAALLLLSRYHAIKRLRLFYWLATTLLVAFSGLRYDVGVDFQNYVNIYYSYTEQGDRAQEPLYNFLMSFGALLDLGPEFPLTISSLAFVGGFAFFFKRYSVSPEISLFLLAALPFFYLGSFNQVRQYAALGLIVISIHFVIQRKPLHFLLSIFGASGFHYAALVFLPAYHFISKRYHLLTYCLVLTAAAITVPILISLIKESGIYSTAYFRELEGGSVTPEMVLLAVGSAFVFFLNYKLDCGGRPEIRVLTNILGLMFVVFALVVTTDIAGFSRVTSMFAWPLLLLIPWLITKTQPKQAQWMATQVVFILSIAYFANTLIAHGNDYNLIPYTLVGFN